MTANYKMLFYIIVAIKAPAPHAPHSAVCVIAHLLNILTLSIRDLVAFHRVNRCRDAIEGPTGLMDGLNGRAFIATMQIGCKSAGAAKCGRRRSGPQPPRRSRDHRSRNATFNPNESLTFTNKPSFISPFPRSPSP